MLKVYVLIHDFSLCTPVRVNDSVVSVSFGGGCKAMRQNGEFCTDDPVLQQALEASAGFGRVYRLLKCYGMPEVAVVAPEAVKADAGAVLEQKVCRTVNEAVEWLVGLGFRKNEVNTSAKAAEAARSRGYELKFVRGE